MKHSVRSASEVLAHARRNARKKDEFSKGGFHFIAVWDHILESCCNHVGSVAMNDKLECSRCLFESSLRLPELPEMVFPKNSLTIKFLRFSGCFISFNALDALKMVSADVSPNVAPSSVWQDAREGIAGKTTRQFDWTFTSKYAGSVNGCIVESTDETIDLERLKRQEPIEFYAQVTLYEDELADHGTAQMSVRLRVMPDFFFALMRFYLRIDRVVVRVCDTRLVGDNDKNYMIREWSLREAKVADLEHLPPEVIHDSNQVWTSLPILEVKNEKITPIRP
ncbi:TIP41-like family protein [Dictyocaulus viviparus]|uniref:TIP41-like protein n=1 Tax=Dictyocaulus viviparus TaxID=29172 RepID=A0A0D8XCQ7_DICVI|nr:TIP41-like family protein [Dictyocaulus viviparus]